MIGGEDWKELVVVVEEEEDPDPDPEEVEPDPNIDEPKFDDPPDCEDQTLVEA